MVRPSNLIAVLASIACSYPASDARSDWQFTKWGDSLEAVLSYPTGKATKLTSQETEDKSIDIVGRALAAGPYVTKDFPTRAYYLFTGTELSGVQLSFDNSDNGLKALEILKSQYGKPNSTVDRMTGGCKDIRYEWDDAQRRNLVRYSFYMCVSGVFYSSILYTPIRSATDTGL